MACEPIFFVDCSFLLSQEREKVRAARDCVNAFAPKRSSHGWLLIREADALARERRQGRREGLPGRESVS